MLFYIKSVGQQLIVHWSMFSGAKTRPSMLRYE
jgi:hypothetical protein